jgi:hypothetical protein
VKKLTYPLVDDVKLTTDMANNERLHKTSFPHLRSALPAVLGCYQQYFDANGNALNINPIGVSADLKSGLKSNYNSPPKLLAYIERVRASSPRVCPMCGSLKTTSLDHVLPKENYPEFSIFSKNLVPACDCNTKRKTDTRNLTTGARVLHPYFDDCLLQRQLSCLISPKPNFPVVDIEIAYVNTTDPLIASLKFHTQKVVMPSGLIGWLESQWGSLVEYPAGIIHTLPHERIVDVNRLRSCLEDALHRHDRGYATANNWESIFVHGLLQSTGVLPWLLGRHNQDYP